MAKNIFELVTATDIVAYWETMAQERAPYFGELLFPNEQKLGLNLEWIAGSSGIPVVINLSGFDAKAVPRDRDGFSVTSAKMPYFKESMYIDEELRQQLNMVLETGKPNYIDTIMNRIFSDNVKLLEAARAQRERMRMSVLSTGALTLSSNGQSVSYDYGIPAGHKKDSSAAWSDTSHDIPTEVKEWMDIIEDDTGVRPMRATCNSSVWNNMLKNTNIRNTIFTYSLGVTHISDATLKAFLKDQLDLAVHVNNRRYKNELGIATKYIADDTFVLFPEGELGKTWFGTTPEESDLMSGSAANVSIADTGVAVTTSKQIDPVNVETKVSMISLPSFEAGNQVLIADVGTH